MYMYDFMCYEKQTFGVQTSSAFIQSTAWGVILLIFNYPRNHVRLWVPLSSSWSCSYHR